ncbi:hypothetical protein [Ectothiorhodospira magna]|uniref:hypothetical protein n=1 Tax=Ectothiorhodospira magna TaxID=867345 RepID=UPI000B7FE5F6|nr:hypothetical protein [Ectothiorhodospira magna]
MSENPFSSYNIEMPKKFDGQVRRFCLSGGGGKSREISPFERQVDFWFCAFVLAVQGRLSPSEEKDTYNVVSAAILSTDPYRVTYIQAVYLAMTRDLDGLASPRKVMDFALGMANAGIPYLIQILDDVDQKPLWNLLDEIEKRAAK